MAEGSREIYIGCPNGVVICVDGYQEGRIEGRLFHSYHEGPIRFGGLDMAFRVMDGLFDRLNFPMRGNRERSLAEERGKRERSLAEERGKRERSLAEERGNRERSLAEECGKCEETAERMVKVMKDEEMLSQHGDLGSFIVRVQHRQHNSWQGQVVWLEKNQKKNFRSALELMKMIDEVVGTDDDRGEAWDAS